MKKIFLVLAGALFLASCNKGDCNDAELNGDETAIDCGGDCTPCETCSDGIKNQDEVNVDCGGNCEPCDIEYPETGTYGTNILHIDDTIYLTHEEYSFRAVIPLGSSLKVRLKEYVGGSWYQSVGTSVGWSISEFSSEGFQDFEALNATCDVELSLEYMTGMFQVWYYENSESVTRVGYVYVD